MRWFHVSLLGVGLVFCWVGQLAAEPVRWDGNGHYYDLILDFRITWSAARLAAESSSFHGVPGHLVTITSAEENEFINSTLNTGLDDQFAWTGGYEPADDGVWLWAVGPESGIQYSIDGVPTPPFNYVGWDGADPNDVAADEDYMSYIIGNHWNDHAPGGWADSPMIPGEDDPIVGYLVEHVPEPSTLALLTTGAVGLLLYTLRRRKSS